MELENREKDIGSMNSKFEGGFIMASSSQPRSYTFYTKSTWRRKLVAWWMLFLYLTQPILASAEVVSDPKAPGNNTPQVQTTANGLPVVQIAAPSTAGVSRNLYQQFSVDPNGLILNNSQLITQTQLAGYITGNPNLANGSARIILNEVTSSSPSYLRGYTEVAGQKAEVIIANSNGIYGDGFGFINTSRAILTTGTPVFGGSGSLDAFRVTGGQIAIQGAGMDATNIDQVDLISRSVAINAGVWAKNLNVVAGSNNVDYNTLHTETISGDANTPQVAIDVGQLGGMYAQKIYLVGTENGVGVNSKGTIAAQAGDVIITSAGQVLLAGNTTATGNIQISAGDKVTNQNTLYAQGNTNITTTNSLENTGILIAGQNTNMTTQNVISTGTLGAGIQNDGTVGNSGDLTIHANGTVSAHGENLAAGNLTINGTGIDLVSSKNYVGGNSNMTAATGDIDHSGGTMQVTGGLNADAQGVIRNDNGTITAGKLTLNGDFISNRSGTLSQLGQETTQITAANSVDNTAGTISTNGNSLTIQGGSLINSQGQIQHAGAGTLTVQTAGDVQNDNGKFITNGQLQITAQNIDNTKGILNASKNMDVNVQSALQNNQGMIASGDVIHMSTQGGIHNQQGDIEANKGLTLAAQSLQNQNGRLVNVDTSDMKVTVGQDIQNQSGIIGGNGKVDITTQNLNNQSGKLVAEGNLTITATKGIDNTTDVAQIEQNGSITSGGDLILNSEDKVLLSGNTTANGTIKINAQGGLSNYSTMVAEGNMDIKTQGTLENSSIIAAGKNTTVTAQNIMSIGTIAAGVQNDGTLGNSGDLTINAGGVVTTHGKNLVAGNLTVSGASLDIGGSKTYAGGNANLTAVTGDIDHSGGTMQVTGGLNANAQGVIRNDSGTINSENLILNANSISNRSGTLSQFGQETTQITAANSVDNTAGTISLNGDSLTIQAGSLVNSQGQIQHVGTGTLTVQTAGDVQNDNGKLITNGQLQIIAQNIDNTKGILNASKNMDVNTQSAVENNQGIIASGDAIHMSAQGGIHNQQGDIEANKGLTLAAQSLQNQNGRLVNVDTSDMKVTVGQDIQNQSGIIGGNGKVDITAQNLSNQSGKITGQDNLTITATKGIDSNITAADVKNDGVLASGKDLVLKSSGNILLSGSTTANGNMEINAQGGLNNNGTLFGNGNTVINTQGMLENSSTIAAGKNTTLTAKNIMSIGTIAAGIQHDGTLGTTGDLNLNANGTISAQGQNMAAGNLTVNGAGINLVSSQTYAGGSANLTATAGSIDNTNALLQADGAIIMSASGALKNDKSTSNTAGIIGSRVTITAHDLSNKGGIIQQTGTAATTLTAGGTLDNTGGTIASNGATSLNVGDLINQGGTIQASGAADTNLTIVAAGVIDNSARSSQVGILAASGNTTITGNSLNNTQGKITAGQGLNVSITQGIVNSQGLLAANQNVDVSGAQINNTQGTIGSVQGESDVNATAGLLDNTAGRIEAAQRGSISSIGLNNTDGVIVGDSLSTNSSTQTLDNTRGKIVATGSTANIQSGILNNEAGLIQATGDLAIDTHGQTLGNTNSGTNDGIVGQGNISLSTGDLNNQSGYVHSGGALTTRSAAIDNTQAGVVTSSAQMDINANALNNQGGQIQALGNVGIHLSGTLNNTGSLVRSGQTLNVSADTITNTGTQGDNQGMEGQSVSLTASQIVNRQGAVRADDDLTLTSNNRIDNTQGLITSGKALTLQDIDLANKTLSITNTGGTLIAGQQLNVNSAGLTGDGKVLSQGNLAVILTQNYTHTGELQANGSVRMETGGTLTNQSNLLAGGNLDISASNIDNTAGSEISAQNTTVATTGTITNRGLIDGDETLLKASTLTNLGTGRIYGDHLAIQSNTFDNGVENGTAPVVAARQRLDIGAQTINNREHALLFSAGDMAIGGSLDANRQAIGQTAVLNNNSATIEALGNLNLVAKQINNTNEHFSTYVETTNTESVVEYQGSGSSNRYTPDTPGVYIYNDESDHLQTPEGGYESWTAYRYTRTTTETKVGSSDPAKIQSGSTMQINADTLTNDKSSIIAGGTLSGNIGSLNNIEVSGERTFIDNGTVTSYWRHHRSGPDDTGSSTANYNPPDTIQEITLKPTVYQENTAHTGTGTQIASLSSSGVNQVPTVASAANVTSNGSLAASQTISSNSTAYQPNTAPTGTNTQGVSNLGSATNQVPSVASAADVTSNSGPAANQTISPNSPVYQPNTASTGTGTQIAPISSSDVNHVPTGASEANVKNNGVPAISPTTQIAKGDIVVRSGDANTKVSDNSLFSIVQNPNIHYLVETDPRFANYRNWVSSDYMLQSLSLDPSVIQKRLGDGFYEQSLIREQVTQLTGQRYLDGYASDEAEYVALMNNAAIFAKEHQLTIGVALTAEQMAQLTSDIVWLVEKDVTLPNGKVTRALVPELYVRSVQDGDLSASGALIAGNNVQLALSGDLTNSGTIAGRKGVDITAENIQNLGGHIDGSDVSLQARTDLNNISGQIEAANSLSVTAGRDLNIASTTSTQTNAQGSITNIDRVAGLYVTGDKGTLVASAGRDINLLAAQINNSGEGGNTTLYAGNNLNLGTVAESSSHHIVWDGNNQRSDSSSSDIGTTIQTQGDIQLTANHDVNAKAATVESSQGAIQVTAGHDVNLTAGEENTSVDEAHQHKEHGLFSSKTITTRDTLNETTAQVTTLSGDSITVKANQNINVKGSNIVATNDVNLEAQGNISITSAQETSQEEHMHKEKSSGLFGGGGLGFTIGSKSEKTTNDEQTVKQAGSTVGSIDGNVSITAGDKVDSAGTTFVAGKDLNITGKDVTIDNTVNTVDSQSEYELKQSGLSVSLGGGAVTAATNTAGDIKRSSEVEDGRLKALYDFKAVEDIKPLSKNGLKAGVSVSVSIGSSQTTSEQTSHTETVNTSNINAGGNVNVTATEGDVNLQGTKINATDVNLDAAKNINIDGADNKQQTTNNTSSSSWSVGGTIGTGYFANTSKGSSNENENAITNTGSVINASDTLTLKSGNDTNIIGSQVSGDKVVATIGGNLNIASKQDTDNYTAKSQSSGFGVSTGQVDGKPLDPGTVGPINKIATGGVTGSVSKGKTDSTYASVTEQAGIFAGKDGFDINVGKNTDLKGAVISSDATPDKNKISTGSLTYSDIQNKADYSASSTGVSVNTNPNAKLNEQGITPNIGVKVSGDADSTTKSAISPGTITITGNQTQDLSKLSRDPSGSLNALGKIFDKETVAEQQELANLFGQEAFKAIGDLKLKEGSPEKVALDAFAGGLMAQLGGGNFASGAAGAGFNQLVQTELAKITDPAAHQWASALVGAVAAKLVGGNAQTGASTSTSETKNNFLSHWQQQQRDKAKADEDWEKVAYWDAIDAAQNQVCNLMNVDYQSIDWEDPKNAGLLQTVSTQAQQLEADPVFQNSYLAGMQTVDYSTLVAAGVIGTAAVIVGVVVYNYNGTLVKVASSGEIAASAAQYQRLKESLAQQEIQSVVRTTEHGVVRLLERGFTPEEISNIKLSPDKIMSQADGANVFIKSLSDGTYSVIVEGENGVVTALRNISEKSLNRLANNYGWE
jgi:filamentous hemagglutinin